MIKNIKFKSKKFKNFLRYIKMPYEKNNNSLKCKPWVYKNLKNFYFKCFIKDNKILGVIVFCKKKFNYHINFLYISSKHRNKKIGYKFLKYLANKKDRKLITTHVHKQLKRSIRFYKKNNFFKYSKYKKIKEVNFIRKESVNFNKNVYNSKELFILKNN